MQTVENKKNRLLAAADIVDRGEMAVVEKIYEFMEFLEQNDVKLSEFFAKIEADILLYKENTTKELSMGVTPISELVNELKGECEEMEDKMGKTHEMMLSEVQSIKSKMTNLVSEIQKVRSEIPEMPEETDLTDIYNRIVEIEGKIPTIPEIPNIEPLKENIKVLQEDMETAKSDIEELKRRPIGRDGGGTSAMGVAQAFKYIGKTEQPVGAIDGNNTTYTVSANIWWIAGFTLNGEQIAQLPNFTYSGRTITFSTALPAAYSGKDFECKYIGT